MTDSGQKVTHETEEGAKEPSTTVGVCGKNAAESKALSSGVLTYTNS